MQEKNTKIERLTTQLLTLHNKIKSETIAMSAAAIDARTYTELAGVYPKWTELCKLLGLVKGRKAELIDLQPDP